ncbi:MAG: ATP-binding protein [Prevotellaceae bacterium]|jgi:AAA+ ATPase superfamily predicted ATPase|nr:ATP-binding protein [Prevotellaceae bacterium]
MSNPFKFGSVVENNFFTDRINETEETKNVLSSSNHLILISPRRFGKTSLVNKVTNSLDRPVIYLDLQLVTDVPDFATHLLKKVLKIDKWENIKHLLANFRLIPTIALNPLTNNMEVSFVPTSSNNFTPLEDVLNLIEKIGEKGKRPIVVFDEFQEIIDLSKTLPKQLRAVIQHHKNINYVFLGSLESIMRQIFETKKSPFYHFGYLMTLKKIPYSDFFDYLKTRFDAVTDKSEILSNEILVFTQQHPYYTQQLAFYCYSFLENEEYQDNILNSVIDNLISMHNNDFERLWNTISKTDKKIMITLALQEKISSIPQPTSTIYSGLKRLLTKGYIIRDEQYELDDPFFKKWLKGKINE